MYKAIIERSRPSVPRTSQSLPRIMAKHSEKSKSQCPPGSASDKIDYKQWTEDDQKNHGWNLQLEEENSDKPVAVALLLSFFFSVCH